MINTLSLTEIYQPIENELKDFESLLTTTLSSEDPFLQSLNEYLLQISGKHLRPALTLLAAKLGKQDSITTAIQLAVAIELLHTATLVHDDIVDKATHRRNHESMNAKWGENVSLICGDYVYAKAFTTLSKVQDPWVNSALAKCALSICEGEMKQVESRSTNIKNESEYLKMIQKKTAALFQAAALSGGYTAGLSEKSLQSLSDYGKYFGLTFQIVDDCLDLVGGIEVLGKEAGSDFTQNDITLPLIYLFESHPEINELLQKNGSSATKGELLEKITPLLESSDAIEKSKALAKEYAEKAIKSIELLESNLYQKSLLGLVEYTLQRIS